MTQMDIPNTDVVRRAVAEILGETIRTRRDGREYVTWDWSRSNPDGAIGRDLIPLEQLPLDDATAIACLQAFDKVDATSAPFEITINVCALLPGRVTLILNGHEEWTRALDATSIIAACVNGWWSLNRG